MMVLQAGFGGGDIPVRFRFAEFFVPASSLALVSPAVHDVIVHGRLSELIVVGAICGCAFCLHCNRCRHDNGRRSCSQLTDRIPLAPGLFSFTSNQIFVEPAKHSGHAV